MKNIIKHLSLAAILAIAAEANSDTIPNFPIDTLCSHVNMQKNLNQLDIPLISISMCENSSSGGSNIPSTPTPDPVVPETTPEPELEPEIPVVVEPEVPVVDPTLELEPEVPDVIDPAPVITDVIIDNEGNFDEDPSDLDIDIIVITEDGEENNEVLNEKDTGVNVLGLTQKDYEQDQTVKEFEIEFSNNITGEKTQQVIVVKNKNAVSTTTENGHEIRSSVTTDEKDIITKVELYTNGTSVVSLVNKDTTTGETKASAIASFKPYVETNVEEDGSVSVENSNQDESGITVNTKATVYSDASVEHRVIRIDEQGIEVVTKAISKANYTVSAVLENGTVQTKAKQIVNDGREMTTLVDGKVDGKSLQIIKIRDSEGVEVVTKAIFEIVGSSSNIFEDGTVETSISKDGSLLKVISNIDGSAEHSVVFGTPTDAQSIEEFTTRATFKIPGAQTKISSDGRIHTSVDELVDGITIKAVVDTDVNGNSVTRFEKYNNSGSLIQTQSTTKSSTMFEPGNKIIVEKRDGKIVIDSTARVSKQTIEF